MSTSPEPPPVAATLYGLLTTAAAAAAVYHGYRRSNGSTWDALLWGGAASLLPFVVLPIALAQGFGEPKAPEPDELQALCGCPHARAQALLEGRA